MTEKNYNKIYNWFNADEKRLKIFKTIYKILPYLVVLGYIAVIISELVTGEKEGILKVLLVPAVTFLLCTVMRKLINKKRPYEILNITPIIKKDKKGQSFPSRHMLSASVIAVSALYVNNIFGAIMLILSIIVGIVRPIAGVHFVKDVIAGFTMGIICGMIGFYII